MSPNNLSSEGGPYDNRKDRPFGEENPSVEGNSGGDTQGSDSIGSVEDGLPPKGVDEGQEAEPEDIGQVVEHSNNGEDGLSPEKAESQAIKALAELIKERGINGLIEALKSEEVLSTANEGFNNALRDSRDRRKFFQSVEGSFDDFVNMILQNPEARAVLSHDIDYHLCDRFHEEALRISNETRLPREDVVSGAFGGMVYWAGGHVDTKEEISEIQQIIEEFGLTPEEIKVARERYEGGMVKGLTREGVEKEKKVFPYIRSINESLGNGFAYKAMMRQQLLQVDPNILQSEKAQQVARNSILSSFKNGYIDKALAMFKGYSLPSEFLQSEEVLSAVEEGNTSIRIALHLLEKLRVISPSSLPPEVFNPESVKQVDYWMRAYGTNYYLKQLIPFLADPEAIKLFPVIGEERQRIVETIPNHYELAENFLYNLDRYYKEPWALGCVAKVVENADARIANYFIKLTQKDETPWKNEPWVEDMLRTAEETMIAYNKSV